jgi:hypothetical protein
MIHNDARNRMSIKRKKKNEYAAYLQQPDSEARQDKEGGEASLVTEVG